MKLRVGDVVEYVITAVDPLGAILEYNVSVNRDDWGVWQEENSLAVNVTDVHVGRDVAVKFIVRSPRQFHAADGYDDVVIFWYDILPRKVDAA